MTTNTKHFCSYLKERNETRSQATKDRLHERKLASKHDAPSQNTTRTVAGFSIKTTPTFFSKFFSAQDSASVLNSIPDGTERVVFIDTPATPHLIITIEALIERGVAVYVRDHHDVPNPSNPREAEIAQAATKVRELCGERALISNRGEHPGCSSLITVGEFAGPNTVIIADNDPDGLTASMKAAGIMYDELDRDAAVLDGPRTEQTEKNLSPVALLLAKGMSTLPPFNAERPHIAEEAKAKLFGDFVGAYRGDWDARARLEVRVAEYEYNVREAEKVGTTISQPIPGVYSADAVGYSRYDTTTLMRLLEGGHHAMVTVIRKDTGPIAAQHGIQYSLAVVREHQQMLNLQKLLPPGFVSSPESGIISNTPFLLHVNEDVWNKTVLPALKRIFNRDNEERKNNILARKTARDSGMKKFTGTCSKHGPGSEYFTSSGRCKKCTAEAKDPAKQAAYWKKVSHKYKKRTAGEKK